MTEPFLANPSYRPHTETVNTPDHHREIIAPANASVAELILLDGNTALRTVTARVETGAECHCTVIQNLPKTDGAVIVLRGEVEGGGRLHWHLISVGGGDVTESLETRLTGPDAMSSVDWICRAGDGQRRRLSATNVFMAPRGGGEIALRIAAEGKSNVSAKGMIEIGEQGGGTQTYLSQKVLMLDEKTVVHTVPSLEIRTNDVKASHGATVTRLTAEDLFACAARGIGPEEAKAMLVDGFLQELVTRIPAAHRELTKPFLGA